MHYILLGIFSVLLSSGLAPEAYAQNNFSIVDLRPQDAKPDQKINTQVHSSSGSATLAIGNDGSNVTVNVGSQTGAQSASMTIFGNSAQLSQALANDELTNQLIEELQAELHANIADWLLTQQQRIQQFIDGGENDAQILSRGQYSFGPIAETAPGYDPEKPFFQVLESVNYAEFLKLAPELVQHEIAMQELSLQVAEAHGISSSELMKNRDQLNKLKARAQQAGLDLSDLSGTVAMISGSDGSQSLAFVTDSNEMLLQNPIFSEQNISAAAGANSGVVNFVNPIVSQVSSVSGESSSNLSVELDALFFATFNNDDFLQINGFSDGATSRAPASTNSPINSTTPTMFVTQQTPTDLTSTGPFTPTVLNNYAGLGISYPSPQIQLPSIGLTIPNYGYPLYTTPGLNIGNIGYYSSGSGLGSYSSYGSGNLLTLGNQTY